MQHPAWDYTGVFVCVPLLDASPGAPTQQGLVVTQVFVFDVPLHDVLLEVS